MTDLAALRTRLAATRGVEYWQTLDELAGDAAFQEAVARAYPAAGPVWLDPIRRRAFLKLMAASFALGGLAACGSRSREPIVPYVRAPEHVVPGKPLYFATAMPSAGGLGLGLLVESHLGRPVKVEGNPDHPASLGATDRWAQASVLTLYDPERIQAPLFAGAIRTWPDFVSTMRSAIAVQRARKGAGLRILTETVTSPTVGAQLTALLAALPEARWHQWDPAASDAVRAGALAAFGDDVRPIHRLEEADVIVALDCDFLDCGPAHLVDVRRFAARRRPGQPMNRLYVAEPGLTPTGAKADHRVAVRAIDVGLVASALAARLGVPGTPETAPAPVPTPWLEAVVRDLAAHRGRSAVLVGATQPATVQALGHLLNAALGNAGRTVAYVLPPEARSEDRLASLRALVDDMQAGKVELLLVVGGDPAFTAPADVPFAAAMEHVPLRAHASLYFDETAARSHWAVPLAHYLEAWDDVRAFDGTATIVQPLIAPLFGGRSTSELMALFGDQPLATGYELVRAQWQGGWRGADFEAAWRTWLEAGVVADTAFRPRTTAARPAPAEPPGAGVGLEVVFRPDPAVHDGRFAQNAWLQELPKPLSHVTWDTTAHVSAATAARLHVATGDVVDVRFRDRSVAAPVWVAPGQADDSVTIHFGYGGRGPFAEHGYDGYAIRSSGALWSGTGAVLNPTGTRRKLAITQGHQRMEGRDIVRMLPIGRYDTGSVPSAETDSLYPPWRYDGHRWAMSIDLGACVGCKACVLACQAENNIPVVGKAEVLRGREMHWLRVDTWFTGDPADPGTAFMPVPCMHCENAPCELVCPVEATVHDAEGLNDMVYNRCVGTRYCSNNCPYKVRRFNFFEYSRWNVDSLKLLYNPDVTVRSRGVMEKCTYCVQRITQVRIAAEREDRRVRDGEVVPACAQACPAEAIVFGDLNDEGSRVRLRKAEARSYALLAELNTQPRTTYLAAITNPEPELA